MLEKLLGLFIHAKAGAISGVFLIGAAGSFVSATPQNGTTTFTVTTDSLTPAQSSLLAPRLTATHDETSGTTPPPDACAVQAQERKDAVHSVKDAYKEDRSILKQERSDHHAKDDRAILAAADKLVKQIRKAAGKAINATKPDECDKHDKDDGNNTTDTDVDANENVDANTNDEDTNDEDANDNTADVNTADGHVKALKAPHAPVIIFTSTDPQGIANEAIAAMTLAVNNAISKLSPADAAKAPKEDRKLQSATAHGPNKDVQAKDKHSGKN